MNKRKVIILVCLLALGMVLSGCKNQRQSKGAHSKVSDSNNIQGREDLSKEDGNQTEGTLYEDEEENGDAKENKNTNYVEENNKENQQERGTEKNEQNIDATYEPKYENAIKKDNAIYDCDIKADQLGFDGDTDIVVGDNLYATQINDWYMNFDQYEGKVVEIEGYYINDFAPYDFIGRYGPSCPYCQGGYVSFEFVSNEDLSGYESGKDWIKITGILREGFDKELGTFYYIEVLQLEKMAKVGKETVTD